MTDSESVLERHVAEVSAQLNQLRVDDDTQGIEKFKKMFDDAQTVVEALKADNKVIVDAKTETESKLEVFRTEYERLNVKYHETCYRHYDEKRQREHEFQKIKRKLMEDVEFYEKNNTELEEENKKLKEENRRFGGMVEEMVPKICVGKTEEEWLAAARDLVEKNIELKIQVENVEKANEEIKVESQKVKDEGEKLKTFLREKYGSEFRSLNKRNMELTNQCNSLTEKTLKSVEGMKQLFEESQKKLAALETVLADPAAAESHSQWSQSMMRLVAKCQMVFSIPYCKLCGIEYNEQKVAKILSCGHSVCDSCAGELLKKKTSFRCPFDRKKTLMQSGKASDLATNFDFMEALEMRFGEEERVVVEPADDNDDENEDDE